MVAPVNVRDLFPVRGNLELRDLRIDHHGFFRRFADKPCIQRRTVGIRLRLIGVENTGAVVADGDIIPQALPVGSHHLVIDGIIRKQLVRQGHFFALFIQVINFAFLRVQTVRVYFLYLRHGQKNEKDQHRDNPQQNNAQAAK